MSETPMKLVIDTANKSEQYIPLSAEEIAQREADAIAAAEELAARELAATELEAAKTAARAKMVAGEPLTEEEALLLIP